MTLKKAKLKIKKFETPEKEENPRLFLWRKERARDREKLKIIIS